VENDRNDVTPRVQTNVKEALFLKRAEVARELKELDAVISSLQREYFLRLEQLQSQKKSLQDALHHVEALLRFDAEHTRHSPSIVDDRARLLITAETSVTDAAFSLLEELHQPMHYKHIAAKLQERNAYIPGRNPAATLLSRMSRDNRFVRTEKRGTYALLTWRLPNRQPTSSQFRSVVANTNEFVRNEPNIKEAFLFKQPWGPASFFAFGIYGKG